MAIARLERFGGLIRLRGRTSRAILVWGRRIMRVVLTIKESSHGLWCLCRGNALLNDSLGFAQAIRLAQALARTESANSGSTVSVEMVCSEFTIVLMHAGSEAPHRSAA